MFNRREDMLTGSKGGKEMARWRWRRKTSREESFVDRMMKGLVLSSETWPAHGQPGSLRQWWDGLVHRANNLLKGGLRLVK